MPVIVTKYSAVLHFSNGTSKRLSFASESSLYMYASEFRAVAIQVTERDQPSNRFARKS